MPQTTKEQIAILKRCLNGESVVVPSPAFRDTILADLYALHELEKREAVRPEIVCLCGSTRFPDAWIKARWDLTLEGKIVLTIGCDTKSEAGADITAFQKEELDELHKRKIDLADRVHVLNVGGYVGNSTRGEIEYAAKHGKRLTYLEYDDDAILAAVAAYEQKEGASNG